MVIQDVSVTPEQIQHESESLEQELYRASPSYDIYDAHIQRVIKLLLGVIQNPDSLPEVTGWIKAAGVILKRYIRDP